MLAHDPSLAAPSAPPRGRAGRRAAARSGGSGRRRASRRHRRGRRPRGRRSARRAAGPRVAARRDGTLHGRVLAASLARHGAVTDDGVGRRGRRRLRAPHAPRGRRAARRARGARAARGVRRARSGARAHHRHRGPRSGSASASGEVFAGSGARRPRGERCTWRRHWRRPRAAGRSCSSRETCAAGRESGAAGRARGAGRGARAFAAAWRRGGSTGSRPRPLPPQDGRLRRRATPSSQRCAAPLRRLRGDDACRRVTIVGPAGIGKSRLVRRARRRTSARPPRVRRPLPPGRRHDRVVSARGPPPRVTGDDAETWIRGHLGDDDRVDVIAERVLGVLGRSAGAAQPGEIAWAVAPRVRGRGARSPARGRRRGRALGGAGAARPGRVHARLLRRGSDAAALRRPPGAARAAAGLGALRGRRARSCCSSRSTPPRRERCSTCAPPTWSRRPPSGSSPPPRATRCSSSSSSPSAPRGRSRPCRRASMP